MLNLIPPAITIIIQFRGNFMGKRRLNSDSSSADMTGVGLSRLSIASNLSSRTMAELLSGMIGMPSDVSKPCFICPLLFFYS